MPILYSKQHKEIVGSVNDAPYRVLFDADGLAEVDDAVAAQLTSSHAYGCELIDEEGAPVDPPPVIINGGADLLDGIDLLDASEATTSDSDASNDADSTDVPSEAQDASEANVDASATQKTRKQKDSKGSEA